MTAGSRFTTTCAALVVLALVLPTVLPPLTTAAAVGTLCFVVIRAVLYFTRH